MVYIKIIQKPEWINICKDAYEKVVVDNEINEPEWLFLEDLHLSLYEVKEVDRSKILKDIKEIAYTKVKVR
jgi:hypothetical protein